MPHVSCCVVKCYSTAIQNVQTRRLLPLAVSFEVPARHHPDADAAGVVFIARAHLDALPDCLLSVAAQQTPADQVVRLSAWPEPNLAVFKVVMCQVLVGCMQQY